MTRFMRVRCGMMTRSVLMVLTFSTTYFNFSVQAKTTWVNFPFQSQFADFNITLSATPNNNNTDRVIGLSTARAVPYIDPAVVLRLNSTDAIDVRDGEAYVSAVLRSHTYGVYVTPPGASKILLASNYAFRTKQPSVSTLANMGEPRTAVSATTTNGLVTPITAIDCVHSVWNNLEACGWPGPNNTGYPAGKIFTTTVNGPYSVTVDNFIIDGWRVTGGIQVRARNVTIRNSWITANFSGGLGSSGTGVISVEGGASAYIEHNLLDGLNRTHTCVWHMGASMTAKFNNCQNVNDGMFSWSPAAGSGTGSSFDGGDNFDIEDNYFHDLTELAANGHIDGYQTEGAKNGVIRHNTYNIYQNQNADIAIWNSRTSSDNILIDNNLLAGGGFSAYAEDYHPSEERPYGGYSVTNITFTNNKWSTIYYPCVGQFGIWYVRGAPTDGWRRSGNIVLETGQNVDHTSPTGCQNLTDTTPPSMPTGVSATAISNSKIALSWMPSSDNVGVTAYRVERCAGAGCSNFEQVGVVQTDPPPPPASHLDTGLASGISYSYRIAAVDLSGNVSKYSATTTIAAQ